MTYTTDSIQKLDFFSAVRKYPGMYIGSKDSDGLHHLAKEIISNSIDEYLNGSCDTINITLHKDGSLEIVDTGRGIPIGKKDNGKTALELCFTEEHAGGKFLNATGKSGYNSAGGMHGLGTKCVNALSDWMEVQTVREGQYEYILFEEGVIKKHNITKTNNDNHGLTVCFKPSEKYLEDTKFNSNRLKTLIREFSFLCKGLVFNYKDENNESNSETFISNNGLYDYIEYLNKDKEKICDSFYFENEDDTFKVEVAFTYNTSYGSEIKLYTNNIPQNKGTHLTGFKTALTSTFNSFAREKKWLKDRDENLTGSDYEEGLVLIINFKMIDPVFKGQNKEELSSSEGRTYVQKFSSQSLREIFEQNEKEIKKIFDKAISARKARNAAKKAREAARSPKKEKGLKAKMALSDKFIDCESKNPSERNLLLVEGLSAGGSTLEARNVKTDCIYMLRGKVISPLKQSIDKILANQEMSDIIRVIGAGFGNDNFDITKMNFDKIVITADQDSDGMDIELLLITFFFTYMRPLVEAGKLYRAVTPLYIITKGKEKIYLYSEEEFTNWKNSHAERYEVAHCKGLGEVSADVLKEICFEKQRYKRITVSDADEAEKLLQILEGKDVKPRKQYIYNNANRLGFNFM